MRPQHFSAGPLGFRFDGDTGFVRYIRFHGHEILRGIYPAVRDRDWATLEAKAEPVEVQAAADSVRMRLSARVVAKEMDFAWTAEIEAYADGRLRYRWHGKAERDCVTSRAGLCVLHPAEFAGTPCTIEHTNGSREPGWFPREIPPQQPFRDIRSVSHVVERAEVVVRTEGEVFEMEDQRNWTDASFKTYCRPLDWPWPYRLAAGEAIEQAVSVEVRGAVRPATAPDAVENSGVGQASLRWPRIGFNLPGPIPTPLRERVRALRPHHVRVETDQANLMSTLEWAWQQAAFLDCPLVLAVRDAGARSPERSSFPLRCIVHLFDAEGNTASKETLAAWRHAGFESIATGTLNHFAELNRVRPPAEGMHALTVFGINAQVHASDDDSVIETLSQHGAVADAAHRIGAQRPAWVGPISLGPSLDSPDSRLRTEFAAKWLLGSLNSLAQAGCVESATYFHSHGPAGIVREDEVTPLEQLLLRLARGEKATADCSVPA